MFRFWDYLSTIRKKYNTNQYSQVQTEDIFDLIYRSKLDGVKAQVTKGITDINFKNKDGQTLLHYALLYNQIKIAEFLITQGANLNAEDNKGQKVKDLIKERSTIKWEDINRLKTPTISIISEQNLEDSQLEESGKANDWWCAIL